MQLSADERCAALRPPSPHPRGHGRGRDAARRPPPSCIRSGDTHFPFRQDSDFGYADGLPGARGDRGARGRRRRTRSRSSSAPRDPGAGDLGRAARRASRGRSPTTTRTSRIRIDELEKELPAWLGKATRSSCRSGATTRSRAASLPLIRCAQRRSGRAPGRGPTALRDAGEILHELRLHEGADRDRAPARRRSRSPPRRIARRCARCGPACTSTRSRR